MRRRRYWSCVYCGEAFDPPMTRERLLQTCFDPSRDDDGLAHVWRPRWTDPSLRDPSLALRLVWFTWGGQLVLVLREIGGRS